MKVNNVCPKDSPQFPAFRNVGLLQFLFKCKYQNCFHLLMQYHLENVRKNPRICGSSCGKCCLNVRLLFSSLGWIICSSVEEWSMLIGLDWLNSKSGELIFYHFLSNKSISLWKADFLPLCHFFTLSLHLFSCRWSMHCVCHTLYSICDLSNTWCCFFFFFRLTWF